MMIPVPNTFPGHGSASVEAKLIFGVTVSSVSQYVDMFFL